MAPFEFSFGSHLKRLSCNVLLASLIFLPSLVTVSASSQAFPPKNAQPPTIAFDSAEDQGATFHLDNVPLQSVLKLLALQGIHVEADPQINPTVTFYSEHVALSTALERILRDINHVITWEQRADGNFFPLTIAVFAPGQQHKMQRVVADSDFRISRHPETGALRAAGELLIRINDFASEEELLELIQQAGGEIAAFNNSLGIYRVRFPADQDLDLLIKQLQSYELVAGVEPNYIVSIPRASGNDDYLLSNTALEKDVDAPRIGVLDSGLLQELVAQPWVAADFDAVDPFTTIDDSSGHGTQMAMLASGVVAPLGSDPQDGGATDIIAVKAFNANGLSTSYSLIESLDFAAEHEAKVISMSWGSPVKSDFLELALSRSAANGIILVAAAGNEATGENMYPAAYDMVIGVGALSPDGAVWDHSNFGSFVEVYAPGFATFQQDRDTATMYGGTSIATAYVANTIATYLKTAPQATAEEIQALLKNRFPTPQ